MDSSLYHMLQAIETRKECEIEGQTVSLRSRSQGSFSGKRRAIFRALFDDFVLVCPLVCQEQGEAMELNSCCCDWTLSGSCLTFQGTKSLQFWDSETSQVRGVVGWGGMGERSLYFPGTHADEQSQGLCGCLRRTVHFMSSVLQVWWWGQESKDSLCFSSDLSCALDFTGEVKADSTSAVAGWWCFSYL